MGARRVRGATALLAGALLTTGCAQGSSSPPDAAAGSGTWTAVPTAPLAPRLGAVTAWTGSEALVLGGDVDDLCAPGAGCAGPPESAVDGAAYDPEGQTWRRVADAPYPVPGGTPSTASGDTVHVVLDDRLVTYDASEDAWSVSPEAPAAGAPGALSALGALSVLDDGRVAVVGAERDAGNPSGLLYDPAGRSWSELPEDPIGPAYDRAVTAVPGGLVLTAAPLPDDAGAAPARLRAAALDLDSGAWRPLGGDDRTGGWNWSWTGERLVDVHPDGRTADGDRFRQGGSLDPRTGSWAPLPGTPPAGTGGWPADAVGGPLAAVDGWVHDDRDGSWTPLERPEDAPAEPGPAVWAGDELLVVGGMDTDAGWGPEHLSAGAWLWRPTSGRG